MKFIGGLILTVLVSLGAAVLFEGCTGVHLSSKTNEQELPIFTLKFNNGNKVYYFRDNGNICYMTYDGLSCVKDTK